LAKTDDEDGGIGAEVSNRLDELFGDEGEAAAASPAKTANAQKPAAQNATESIGSERGGENTPIKNLKALVYGIDWEITDDSMMAFLKEVHRLEQQYQNDKILSMFLKLHDSIGKYIKAKKARAHPDAIKFVTSVFKNFEKVLLTPGMSEIQKKRLLSGEVQKFKDFRQRVMTREKAITGAEPAVVETVEIQPRPLAAKSRPAMSLDSPEALDYIVEELKKTIKAEFHTIRQILKTLGA